MTLQKSAGATSAPFVDSFVDNIVSKWLALISTELFVTLTVNKEFIYLFIHCYYFY